MQPSVQELERKFGRIGDLFKQANRSGNGYVTPQEAVSFFPRFGLSKVDLGKIWQSTHTNNKLNFDAFKKYVSEVYMKVKELEIVFYIPPAKRKTYEALYEKVREGKSNVSGTSVRALFMKSGVGMKDLKGIWNLADSDKSGSLSKKDFTVAMHLLKLKSENMSFMIPSSRIEVPDATSAMPPVVQPANQEPQRSFIPPPLENARMPSLDELGSLASPAPASHKVQTTTVPRRTSLGFPAQRVVNTPMQNLRATRSQYSSPAYIQPAMSMHQQQQRQFALTGQVNNLLNESKRLTQESLAVSREKTRMSNQLEAAQVEADELEKTVEEQKAQLDKLRTEKSQAENVLMDSRTKVTILTQEKRTYQSSMQILQQEMFRLQPLRNEAKQQRMVAQKNLETVQTQLEKAIGEFVQRKGDVERIQRELEVMEEEFEQTRGDMEAKEKEVVVKRTEMVQLDKEVEKLKSALVEVDVQKKVFGEKVRILEDEIRGLKKKKSEIQKVVAAKTVQFEEMSKKVASGKSSVLFKELQGYMEQIQTFVELFNRKIEEGGEVFENMNMEVEELQPENEAKVISTTVLPSNNTSAAAAAASKVEEEVSGGNENKETKIDFGFSDDEEEEDGFTIPSPDSPNEEKSASGISMKNADPIENVPPPTVADKKLDGGDLFGDDDDDGSFFDVGLGGTNVVQSNKDNQPDPLAFAPTSGGQKQEAPGPGVGFEDPDDDFFKSGGFDDEPVAKQPSKTQAGTASSLLDMAFSTNVQPAPSAKKKKVVEGFDDFGGFEDAFPAPKQEAKQEETKQAAAIVNVVEGPKPKKKRSRPKRKLPLPPPKKKKAAVPPAAAKPKQEQQVDPFFDSEWADAEDGESGWGDGDGSGAKKSATSTIKDQENVVSGKSEEMEKKKKNDDGWGGGFDDDW